jgi:hypothetical protein
MVAITIKDIANPIITIVIIANQHIAMGIPALTMADPRIMAAIHSRGSASASILAMADIMVDTAVIIARVIITITVAIIGQITVTKTAINITVDAVIN